MKYPATQFETLLTILKQFAVHFDLNSINPHSLHYMVFQQLSEGQTHNHLYCVEGGTLKRYFQLTEPEKLTAVKFIESDFDFQLYPSGCNDNHVETAMRNALKQLKN